MIRNVAIVCWLLCLSCVSQPNPQQQNLLQSLQGKVVKILDGDTYDLLLDNKTTIRIRMYGIDAPERRMPFYQKSKDLLGSLCFGKNVRIIKTDTDRNGRWIAKTFIGADAELGLQMIEKGMAWHYKKYASSKELSAAEQEARTLKLGLWADPNPVAPWDWRKSKRENKHIGSE